MSMIELAYIAGSISGGLIGGIAVVYPKTRRLGKMIDDWIGEDARPGVPRRPGVMERLAIIESKVNDTHYNTAPNHGGSSYDAQMRVMNEILELLKKGKKSENTNKH